MTEVPNGSVSRFIPVISDCEPLDPYKIIHDMTQILSCISCITVSKNHFSAASAVNDKTVFHVRHDPQGKNRFHIPVFISGKTADIIFLRCQQYTDAVKEPSCQMAGSWIRVLPLDIDQKYIRIGCFTDIQNQ